MKTITKLLLAGTATVTLLAGVAVTYATNGPVGRSDRPITETSTVGTQALSATAANALLHMVEEEKLAHDVYVTLGASTGSPIFDRISSSETTHESELRSLVVRYGLNDPTAGHGVGDFTDPAFTTLYTQLVAEATSNAAAMGVGTTIEELDIADLRDRLTTDLPSDVASTFERLIAGSERHLAAFDRQTGSTD
jgi:hypothetical protein